MLGILLPGSLGVVSYGLLVSVVSAHVPEKDHSLASGVVNASSGIGSTLLAPMISMAIAAGGLANGMMILTALAAVAVPVTLWMCRDVQAVSAGKQERVKASWQALAGLLHTADCRRNYTFIAVGFFTCGFHMALITNHLATEIVSFGFTNEQSAYAFSIYGIATIAGALIIRSGQLQSSYAEIAGDTVWASDGWNPDISAAAENDGNYLRLYHPFGAYWRGNRDSGIWIVPQFLRRKRHDNFLWERVFCSSDWRLPFCMAWRGLL